MQWDDFLPHVLPYVEGCPDPLAIDHVVKAARTFCQETRVWNYQCDAILSGEGVQHYALQIGEGQELVRLLDVAINGESIDILRGSHGRMAARRGAGRTFAYVGGPLTFSLHPTPRTDTLQIVTDIAVKPALGCREWPDDLAEYVADIAHGAVWTLCGLPKKEWRDAQASKDAEGQFFARIAAVKADVERGYGRSARPAVSRYF